MRFRTALAVVVMVFVGSTRAEEILGKVTGVHDGDTITVLTPANKQYKIRLGEIDTPESKQPWGTNAKKGLSDLVFGKEVRVVVQNADRYGRTVGRVYVGSVDVNLEMAKSGNAWVYRQYAKDQALFKAEDEAKAAKRGLWSLPEADRMPPWEWRSGGFTKNTVAPADTSSFKCGAKKMCKEMTSCDEAKFYLVKCGVLSLDGNKDGVPCEALCKGQ